MKIAVNIYRRPGGAPIYNGVALDDAMLHASELRHNMPAYGFAEPSIAIVCTPKWERAVSEFLAGYRGDRNVTAAQRGNGAVARESEPRGARARSAPVKAAH